MTATTTAPTPAAERIFALDTIRGFAVLGILLMNILGMGLPDPAYEMPSKLAGGDTGWNLYAWIGEVMFFEGTMRGLFTLLFGAGVILYTERLERAGLGVRVADYYYRRNLWLWIFGIVNAHLLLWRGDILFFYGLTALFLFVFRNLPVRKLLLWATLILAIQTWNNCGQYFGFREMQAEGERVAQLEAQGQPLDEEQQNTLKDYRESQEGRPAEEINEEVGKVRASYASARALISPDAYRFETRFFPSLGLWECLYMMLIGMALYRSGAFTLGWSTRAYVTMLIAGYGIGLTVNGLELRNVFVNHFSAESLLLPWTLTYDLGRIPMTLGHVAAVMLLLRSGALRTVLGWFAATGQMALTNYLMQSVFALFLFTGAGLALFGQLQRYQLYFIVLAIWIVELAWSPLWLKYFHYGPMEWLWRSLTRWERQPFRRQDLRELSIA